MAVTLTTSGATLIKAGRNVHDNIRISGALGISADNIVSEFINQAESYLNIVSRYNWIDNYSSLNADVKKILDEATSNLAGIYCILYDLSYKDTSRVEAEDRINLLWTRFKECVEMLKEDVNETFMRNA